jgi:hypothetical protein
MQQLPDSKLPGSQRLKCFVNFKHADLHCCDCTAVCQYCSCPTDCTTHCLWQQQCC